MDPKPSKDNIRDTILFYFPRAVVHKHNDQEYTIILPQSPESKDPGVELTLTTRMNQWRKTVWNLSQNRFPSIEGTLLSNLLKRLPELAEASREAAKKQNKQAKILERALAYNPFIQQLESA